MSPSLLRDALLWILLVLAWAAVYALLCMILAAS